MLVSGRLGAVYGHGNVLMLGGVWFILWTFINTFCSSFISFNIVRGLSGVGGAMILPNAVAIIGITFPPGKQRNMCVGIFGAANPMSVLRLSISKFLNLFMTQRRLCRKYTYWHIHRVRAVEIFIRDIVSKMF